MIEHRQGTTPGFTGRYHITRLVYFEETTDAQAAIAREKEIKGWRRVRKIALVEGQNPDWRDLSDGWFDGEDPSLRSG